MLNQLSVKMRLVILVALPLFFFAVSALNSLFDLRFLNNQISNLYNDRVVPLQQIKQVADNYAVETVDILHKYRAGIVSKSEFTRRLELAEDVADEQWGTYKSTKLTIKEERLVEQVEVRLNAVKKAISRYQSQVNNGNFLNSDPSVFARELYAIFDPLSESYKELIQLQLDEANLFRLHADEEYENTVIYTVISLILMLTLMLVMAVLIYRSVSKPLGNLRSTISEVANSVNLSVRADVTGQDEIAETAIGFNQMLDRLHKLVKETTTASTTLASSAEEMHAISSQMATTASEQEHRSNQIATAITEMTVAIQQVAENAQQTSEKANRADEQAQLGEGKVQQNIHSIEELSKVVNHSSEIIQQLHHQTNEINQVVQLIQNVAEQTNLLALNAAIEAARAGESGRGFAVVADEVRELAHNTKKATESISQMIGNLQASADDAVDSMSKVKQMGEDSVSHAQESSLVLKEIIESLTIIADMNIQVSTATEEQTAVANEISENVNEFSSGIAMITESSNQNTQASDDLSDLATSLQEQVSLFKV